jgi:hypothetical protein|tara:strand:- start:386 stop:1492 length:1107 start_codon:yes stop_codon:yes gene_type:complete
MVKIYSFFKFFLITVFFIVLLDVLVGSFVYKKFIRGNFIDVDLNFGRRSNVFHHNLVPNYKTDRAGWGSKRYNYCTDANSFRSSCKDQFRETKNFDIGFIGSSMTEGIGVNYEDSYVGMIASKLKDKEIANLALPLYSSSIYYAKINRLLSQGYKFKEIIVFMDITDLRNETVCYRLENDQVLERETYNNCFLESKNREKLLRLIKKRLKLSFELYKLINNKLIEIGILEYKIPRKVVDDPVSRWTYNYNPKDHNEFTYGEALNLVLGSMQKLSDLLKRNDIKLGIAVYPLPATLKNDIEENKQLKIWEEFCKKNCESFYNLMSPFYQLLNDKKYSEVYKNIFIKGDIHFNKFGNKIMAENFLKLYNK